MDGCYDPRATHLGIRTPGRHLSSRLPNGWVPRMYCSGSPLPRRRHRAATWCSAAAACDGEGSGVSPRTCSRIHLSSLAAEFKSRHVGRRVAACGEMWCARRKSEGGMRGIWW